MAAGRPCVRSARSLRLLLLVAFGVVACVPQVVLWMNGLAALHDVAQASAEAGAVSAAAIPRKRPAWPYGLPPSLVSGCAQDAACSAGMHLTDKGTLYTAEEARTQLAVSSILVRYC
jgi:hypothetical protein